jgi:beta-glucosidase
MSGEATSRASLDLPGLQLDLVKAVHATGTPTVVVLMNGRPLAIEWVAAKAPAIVEAWYPGVEAGHAIADALFGRINPGGKLPVTFPRAVGQVPIHYNHMNTGRPASPTYKYTSKYIDLPIGPLWPFGHGLSYTWFGLSGLALDAKEIAPDGRVGLSVELRNVGDRGGDEVVQLYVRDVAASVVRPVRELRGFERVTLGPGEARTLRFSLGPEDLGFYDRQMRFVVEPGEFRVFVGTSSEGGLEGRFDVVAR